MKTPRRRPLWAALFFGAGLLAVVAYRLSLPAPAELAREIRTALNRDQAEAARRLAEQAIARYPRSAVVRAAAADAELASGDEQAALEHLLQIPDDDSRLFLDATGTAGDLLFQHNRLTEAERCFRRVLRSNPRNLAGQQRLALLLALAGRRTAAQDVFFEILRGGEFDTRDLALCGEPDQVFDNPQLVKRFEDLTTTDPAALRGAARWALIKNKSSQAAESFRRLVQSAPDDLDAQAGLGRALLDLGDAQEFLRWHAALPPAADSHAEIWSVRGQFAATRAEPATAIRCFAEAVLGDPNQILTNTQLGVLLNQQGAPEAAARFQARAAQLRELKEAFDIVLADSSHTEYLLKAAQLTERLGRLWEAHGWLEAAANRAESRDLAERAARLAESLTDEVPLNPPEANPAGQLDLSRFPRPDWRPGQSPGHGGESPGLAGALLRFQDLARTAGVDFQFFNGHDPQVQGFRIFETTGGGVAALDFDGDHWPDLYFTQAGPWPPQPGQTEHLDRLYRNLGNGHFADVTAHSGLSEDGYSQGVAAGDIDNDGFPDLYVANIGQNRLYSNNGDGTFVERTLPAGLAAGGWTTSVLIADLNGDSFPEIYDTTYVAGRLPFEHLCHDRQNKALVRICAPSVFVAEPDRLFLNRGDGTFQEIGTEAGINIPDGKGLGVIAADLDGSGRVSLYVANDTTPNFLFINETPEPGASPRFAEQAKLVGCAVNGDGIPPASMGIAVGDSDDDGLLDVFITTFYGEPDVLFRQQPGGLFVDVTSPAGLKEPTVPLLGFGTQFLDGDLDGQLDLVLANGHVDDLRDLGIPYHMRAQCFLNRGQGRFTEVAPSQAGDYFQAEHLGRGLARLDWNRDGREDFAVSNLDTPASLVTNQTEGPGHYLSLMLHGVQSSRDAIGAIVTARCGQRRIVRQLTAGDGYQASNQRLLVFGLGTATIVDELTIHWPSGREQTLQSVAADTEYAWIEGRDALLPIPRPER